MSDPALDPQLDLVDFPQDAQLHPRVRLGTVLALLRVAAGPRGVAGVIWHRFGFTYELTVRRERTEEPDPVVAVGWDPDAVGGERAALELRDRLG